MDLEERIANSHVLINDEGEIVQIYDKIHLFDAPLGEFELSMLETNRSDSRENYTKNEFVNLVNLEESKYVKPGDKIHDPIDTPIGNLGLGS